MSTVQHIVGVMAAGVMLSTGASQTRHLWDRIL